MADVPQPQMISRNRGRVKYLKTMVTENVSRGYDSFGHGYLLVMVTRRRRSRISVAYSHICLKKYFQEELFV